MDIKYANFLQKSFVEHALNCVSYVYIGNAECPLLYISIYLPYNKYYNLVDY